MAAALVPTGAAMARRTATIHVHASQQARDLIERAAEATGRSMTDVVLESATKRAVEVLLDRRLFALGEERSESFVTALDRPPPPSASLKALMRKSPPWEG